MKLLIQRVSEANVSVDGKIVSQIGKGILAFIGIEKGDTMDAVGGLAKKLLEFRLFEDKNGKMNLSIKDVQGEILVVSEFTLAADVRKGARPSFDSAEVPDRAKEMITAFVRFLKDEVSGVKEGIFGAHMEVSLRNDGPVTFYLSL